MPKVTVRMFADDTGLVLTSLREQARKMAGLFVELEAAAPPGAAGHANGAPLPGVRAQSIVRRAEGADS